MSCMLNLAKYNSNYLKIKLVEYQTYKIMLKTSDLFIKILLKQIRQKH